jgi:hypothetical protein
VSTQECKAVTKTWDSTFVAAIFSNLLAQPSRQAIVAFPRTSFEAIGCTEFPS